MKRMIILYIIKKGVSKVYYESSICCGSNRWHGTDICSECREHADFETIDTAIDTENVTEGMQNADDK